MSTEKARASRQSPSERVRQIADVADRLAVSGGLSTVTHRAIADVLGITHSLVAKYVPDIDQLRRDVYERLISAELEAFRVVTSHELSAVLKLARLVQSFSHTRRQALAVVWFDGWIIGSRHEETATVVRSFMQLWQLEIEGILSEGVEAGEFAVKSLENCAAEFVAILDGFNAHLLVRFGDPITYPKRIASAFASRLGIEHTVLEVYAQ